MCALGQGALYGYVGLKLLEANTPEDDETFDAIAKLAVEIATCGGCSLDKQTAANVDLSGFKAP